MVQTLCKLYLLYLNTHPLMTPTLSSPGIHPLGFPGGTVVKNLPAKAGRHRRHAFHLWVKSGRSPGEANGNSLQYSCLGNPMERGAWQAIVHGVTKSQTQLSD